MIDFQGYFQKICESVNPYLACFWTLVCWIMFPDAAYIPAAIAVGISIVLDLFTKLYALSVNNGGYKKATEKKVIISDTLWKKTQIKLLAYLTIMILAGLSIRVAPLQQLGIFLATVVYAVIFIRESQSILENLIEAGAEGLRPLLFWLKKKEKQITESEGTTEQETNNIEEENSNV